MIVLDTNVLSEIIRTAPEPRVMQWLQEQSVRMLFTTTITRAELLYGAPAACAQLIRANFPCSSFRRG